MLAHPAHERIHTRPVGPETRHHTTVAGPIGSSIVGIAVGGFIGVALGWWCRSFAMSHSVNGVLADLGAPWVVAAFVAGALLPSRLGPSGLGPLGRLPYAGAIAGATCLVVATFVYYGPARTGAFDVSGARLQTAFWTVIGVGVGLLFGAVGSWWRSASTPFGKVVCLVVLGAAITAEAFFVLDVRAAWNDDLFRDVLVAVAIAGAAVPLLAGLRWHAVAGIVAVGLLAVPVSVSAVALWRVAAISSGVLRGTI